MFAAFSHVMFYVSEMDRAVTWYSEQLGFEARFVAPQAYASLFHKELRLRVDLHQAAQGDGNIGHGPIPYFGVTDIEATAATLRDKGIKVSEIRQEGDSPRFASFFDSEGNCLGIEESMA